MSALPPGSTIGILGGGQLGRMLAISAAQIGYRCHIFAPEKQSVAAEVSAAFTCASYHDEAALTAFAKDCDVITYEFENVPVKPLQELGPAHAIHPPIAALDVAQDRENEKNFALLQGGATAPFAMARSAEELADGIAKVGPAAILKTVRMGYDGKGQIRLSGGEDAATCWQDLSTDAVIVEGLVPFEHEFSVILVRARDGHIAYWDTPKNVHENGILASSTVPAPAVIGEQEAAARSLAAKMAEALDYVGVMTCEFFAGADGPVFNEMAPRVHNSGHWTIEGALTSQFENHIRAICGLPLGDTGLAAPHVEMTNLIGGDADAWQATLADPAAHLHLYGKAEAREGRKMGHVTRRHFD